MKIVDLTTFRAMPAGTLFSKYAPCYFEALTIKGDTWEYDFLTQQIADAITNTGSDNFCEQLDDAQATGGSLTMDFDCLGRDGCFDKDQLFAVWERPDVEALISRLQETLK